MPSGIWKSEDNEGLELFHQILAMVGVDLKGDGLGKVEAEDAEDRLAIDNMTADAQVDVIRIAVCDVDEGLHILCKAELDVDCFHDTFPHLHTLRYAYARIRC